MNIKKGLVYSPLNEPKIDDSQFDFVKDRKPVGGEKATSIFKDIDRSVEMELRCSFPEAVKKKAREETEVKAKAEKKPPEKKITSYYLEKNTLTQLKQYADEQNKSYSSVVEMAIKNYLASLVN